jgi:hypothetical protein
MIAALTFAPDGIGRGLYTEAIDLSGLGLLHIERATTIEFDNAIQTWRVRDASGRELFAAASRQHCLEWEQRHFSRLPLAASGRTIEKRVRTEQPTEGA